MRRQEQAYAALKSDVSCKQIDSTGAQGRDIENAM